MHHGPLLPKLAVRFLKERDGDRDGERKRRERERRETTDTDDLAQTFWRVKSMFTQHHFMPMPFFG